MLTCLFSLCFLLGIMAPALAGAENQYPITYVKKSLMLDVSAVDGLVAAVGERGHVLISTDLGKNWTQADVPVEVGLTGVYFHDAKLGWAVGNDHVIIRTRDGGKSWKRLYDNIQAESPLLDVWFRDADNGFAIGAYGAFLTTNDGGDSWQTGMLNLVDLDADQPDPDADLTDEGTQDEAEFEEEVYADYHLNQIARSDSGKLYIAAEAGNMYRSDDKGQSWVLLPSPYRGSFFGVLPLEGESLLMFGLRGHLFRSDDSGESWQELRSGTQALLSSGIRLPDGTILVSGRGGVVLVSRDKGQTFSPQRLNGRRPISSGALLEDRSLVFVGAFGVKKVTVNDLGLAKVTSPIN